MFNNSDLARIRGGNGGEKCSRSGIIPPIVDEIWTSYLLPALLIMAARVLDVSIGTVRIILVSRGKGVVAATLGFFEVIIWLLAVTRVLANVTNVAAYIGYGLGFGLGNLLGIEIEKRLAIGMQIIRIIKPDTLDTLQMMLRDEGYGVTTVEGYGGRDAVEIIYVVTERKDTQHALRIIDELEPDAFVSVQDIYSVQRGVFRSGADRRRMLRGRP